MRLAADGWRSRFQTLVAIIMSARTRDETTIKVAENLFKRYPDASSLSRAPVESIEKYIRPVNFFHNKAKSISACALLLARRHKGVPPQKLDELVLLPGVGRKTANVFLAQYGTNAIGVDTHVAYIARALRWSTNTNPHKVELDLEKLFPERLWKKVNVTCVRFGKTHMSRKKKDILLARIRSL